MKRLGDRVGDAEYITGRCSNLLGAKNKSPANLKPHCRTFKVIMFLQNSKHKHTSAAIPRQLKCSDFNHAITSVEYYLYY